MSNNKAYSSPWSDQAELLAACRVAMALSEPDEIEDQELLKQAIRNASGGADYEKMR